VKIHNCAQGEAEWSILRSGKVTASEIDALISPEWKIRTGQGVQTYLCQKLAEKWRGGPLPGFYSHATEEGQMLEDQARKWVAFNFDERLTNVGFCESDDGRCGCSPDALIGDDGGLELKVPQPINQIRYVLEGTLPKDYAAQVHMSMYVTGRKWWKFVSYRPGFPPFVLTVNRDEKIIARIGEALAAFYKQFDADLEKITKL